MNISAGLRQFFKMEAAGGIVLVIAAALAVVVANSPFANYYQAFLQLRLTVQLGDLGLSKPLVLWINDGLMALFFFLVGMEIKRELLEGELASLSQAVLPLIAAVGGMAVPALIYVAINAGNGDTVNGWAIPAATDIAFAIGVLTLLGSRVPFSLKVLLTAIAVFDDLGAIVIIALFYTYELSMLSLALAAICLIVLLGMNLSGVRTFSPYLVVGALLWLCVLKSGVHATLAGVAVAAFIPLTPKAPRQPSLLHQLEHSLHNWVAFGVLPLFGFANAGVSFAGMTFYSLLQPITLGIILGLFVGKQVGIFGTAWLAVRLGVSRMPAGASWPQVYAMATLCGIGFTMSLFIGGLAWEHGHYDNQVRLGVIVGSLASAIVGATIMVLAGKGRAEPAVEDVTPGARVHP